MSTMYFDICIKIPFKQRRLYSSGACSAVNNILQSKNYFASHDSIEHEFEGKFNRLFL